MTENDANPHDSNLRQRAEQQLGPSTGSGQGSGQEETQRLLHELRVNQIELEVQNEELRRVQAELEASHSRYFDLFNMAPVGYVTLNQPGLILNANLTAAGLLGMERSALVKRPLTRFILPDDQDIYYLIRKQLYETGAPQVCELRMLKKDGAQIWVQMQMTGAQDADGAPVSRVTLSDITEHKQAEENIRILATLSNISPVSITVHDLQANFLYANQRTFDLHGYTKDEFLARNLHEIDVPASADLIEARIQKILETGEASFEVEHYRKDGTCFPLEVNVKATEWGGKKVLLSVASDITERKRAEEALHESEERFRTLVDNLPGIVYRCEPTVPWRISFISTETEAISGFPARDFQNGSIHSFNDIELPEDVAFVDRTLNTAIADKRSYAVEYRIRHADGSIRWVYERGRSVYSEGGVPLWLDGVIFDITERKQAEEAVRESEARFRNIAEQMVDVLYVTDNQGVITYISPSASNVFGWTPAEMTGQRFTEYLPEDEDPKAMARFQAAIISAEGTKSLALTMKRKDGSLFFGELNGSRIVSQQGIMGILGMIRDITERKRAEEALRESEERYRSLFDRMLDGIYRSTHEGKFVDVNPAMVKMFGYSSKEEMLEVDIKNELYFAPEERGSHILDTGQEEIEIYRMRCKDGSEIWVEDHGHYVHDAQGRVIYHEGMMRDITERKQLTEKMLQSQKLAGLGTLAAGVAHEINSPLQIITGDSESLIAQLKEGEPEQKEILRRAERINRNAWRIAHIVRSLLDYTRSTQEQLAQADLNSLVGESLLLTEHQIHVWSNIEVVTELAENLPEFTCDSNKIIQVLINLLSNARDAMPNGGTVTIRTGFDPQSQRLTLTVSDTGQGIPKDQQSKIFDPFFTTKPPGQGTGLGLSVVAGIVHSHGGEIKVQSAPGQGSTFLVNLALTPPAPPPDISNEIGKSLDT